MIEKDFNEFTQFEQEQIGRCALELARLGREAIHSLVLAKSRLYFDCIYLLENHPDKALALKKVSERKEAIAFIQEVVNQANTIREMFEGFPSLPLNFKEESQKRL